MSTTGTGILRYVLNTHPRKAAVPPPTVSGICLTPVQECINIVHSHTNARAHADISTLFVYGARHLVSFTQWPLHDAYSFYLSNKPWPPGSAWGPVSRKLTEYQRGTFGGDHPRAIREMRRAWGRDVNDSDLAYDSENDSGDDDYW